MRVLMAVGNTEIEAFVEDLPEVQRAEAVEDIDLIREILSFESYDFVLINSLLSSDKTIRVVRFIQEQEAELAGEPPKIIVFVKDFTDRTWIAQMAGLGVHAFITFDQIHLVQRYLREYPEAFDWIIFSANQADEKELPIHSTVAGTISIGVFSLQHGAGATTTACRIAEAVANCGHRVICVEIGSVHLDQLRKGSRNVEYISTPEEEKDAILQVAYGNMSYPIIVIDFGQMFQTDSSGQLLSSRQACIGDFLRCNYKVGMCFASDWYTDQLQLFLKNEFFREDLSKSQLSLLVSGEDTEGAIADYHELPIWSRDDWESFITRFLQQIGFREQRAEVKKKIGFWKGKKRK